MAEVDMFARLLEKLGEPEQARKVSAEEARRYAGRLPDALLQFWQEHGRGAYKGGSYWFCDPAPYERLVEAIFRGDPELDPAVMTAIGYDAFGTLCVWHPDRYDIAIDLLTNDVHIPSERSRTNSRTGVKFTPDYSIKFALTYCLDSEPRKDGLGEELMPKARARQGPLGHNEMYAYVPTLRLGGALRLEDLRRVSAPEHMMFLASLEPLIVRELTRPEPPLYPYGRTVTVRRLGSQ